MSRFQRGSLFKVKRKSSPDVWVFRWYDNSSGKRIRRGSMPLSSSYLLRKSIRPALARAGIVGKNIGWHSFRHSLATNLRALGIDIKVAQELLRHASCRTTLDVYTRAVSHQKRDANAKVVEMMLRLEMKKKMLFSLNPTIG